MDRQALEALAQQHVEAGDGATMVALLQAALSRSWEGTLPDDTSAQRQAAPTHEPSSLPVVQSGRYEEREHLGLGGSGVVHLVFDRTLNRTVARKVLRAERMEDERSRLRFIAEAQTQAQLQHPNIVPIHEVGQLADGRPYFTMQQVRGQTLATIVAEVHGAAVTGWRASASGWTFRRLVSIFQQVCGAVAHAHSKGVCHRDLKPQNVMVGPFGEAFVVDWGLAKALHRADLAPGTEPPGAVARSEARDETRSGQIKGTPAYMAPEQARGEIDAIGELSDIYALGAILYQILSGRPPYEGSGRAVLHEVQRGPPRLPAVRTDGLATAQDLVDICARAMERAPADRYPMASELADEVAIWLDGARAREQALEIVAAAEEQRAGAQALRERSRALAVEAAGLLEGIAPYEPEQAKAPGWAVADEAAQLEQRAQLAEIAAEHRLTAALQVDPTAPEAHRALLWRYLEAHRAAESDRDPRAAALSEARMQPHLSALPRTDEARVDAVAYLAGDGALTLVTDPPGAEVLLYRYVEKNRRLVEVFERSLGPTPLSKVSLPMGSYLCLLRAEGRAEVRYPVFIGRREHWHGVPPGATDPLPIALPRPDELSDDDCYVPAGWFWAGGDPIAYQSLARQRLWCDAMVFERFPVTNRRYLAFLDDLVANGRESEAQRFVPRERAGTEGERGTMIYGFDGTRFSLRPDADGDIWLEDYPVVMVDWHCAAACAAWCAERTGLPWRLPGELEWEKAARGTDGRPYPFGSHLDPSWCHMNESHRGPRVPAVVDSYPTDVTPYGVRGTTGNVCAWCADVFAKDGPAVDGRRVPRFSGLRDPDSASLRTIRGGTWNSSARTVRAALRARFRPTDRNHNNGIRLVRSWSRER